MKYFINQYAKSLKLRKALDYKGAQLTYFFLQFLTKA